MKRAPAVSICVLAFGAAAVFGVMKAMPLFRQAVEMDRYVRQAALREPAAQQDWKRQFGDPVAQLAKFPREDDSEAAARLIEAARAVGINMARPTAPESSDDTLARPSAQEPASIKALHEAISDYGNAELAKSGGRIDAPSGTVGVYLQAHEKDVAKIIELLISTDRIAWKSEVSLGSERPIPNLLGQLRLQNLLVAHALLQSRLGRDHDAEQALMASWVLNAAIRDRPEIISQLIATSICRKQVGLIRRLSVASTAWQERLASHDYRASLLTSMEIESISVLRRLPGESRFDRASRTDFLDLRRSILVRLRSLPVSDAPLTLTDLSEREPETAGAIIATMGEANLGNAIRRVDRLIIDTELTQRILEARIERLKLGHWPATIPNLNPSRMTGVHWTYSVDAKGTMRLELDRELHWDGARPPVLPLRYESND